MTGLRLHWMVAIMAGALALYGCGSTPVNKAPVEDRTGVAGKPSAVGMDPRTAAVHQPPGFENAGKPGYYTIKPGDTLIRIGLETGQSYKDIARWNGLDNPNHLEVGQVVRVVPPVAGSAVAATATTAAAAPAATASDSAVSTKPVASSAASTTALPAAGAATKTPATSGAATTPAASSAPSAAASTATATPSAASSSNAAADGDPSWMWPSNGAVLAGFDEAKNKGVDIGGKAGDPVVAVGDGKVVYAGSGLRGYGNLIILKHDNTYLTAYAHNQTLLVKEDQLVKKGQKIAVMGDSDSDKVKLHFEVRKQGKPVDPTKYLPSR
ncbi:peptidoglycan DD-metalloendopeptidase family protein [Curvibacter sp. CHRR-16]|uniref:peptidoglycan DD-metalloendopeptidase family protein n=1 Tax=Curvibacter sp. CHRR-16 TaxID=2835872 RepID=UPI001BD9D32F|nr:peptidoglycan DD-metalloendopeptidase family protein [Curvibacter sp. CHRR-16]MBT0571154.1 peptidoglycan DD-metalloendopeptidase family protein [Curvibacter sp. CHRR-16]